MRALTETAPATWIRTDRAVVRTNTVRWDDFRELESALHEGLLAVEDPRRPGFFEVEIGEHWYYLHITNRISGVYLIAARSK